MERVVVYQPGAILGVKLKELCTCPCHSSSMIHMFPCCKKVKGFSEFPNLDENGKPVNKLPNCPYCVSGELMAVGKNLVECPRCGWKIVRKS